LAMPLRMASSKDPGEVDVISITFATDTFGAPLGWLLSLIPWYLSVSASSPAVRMELLLERSTAFRNS
jgi:hypothetical protein